MEVREDLGVLTEVEGEVEDVCVCFRGEDGLRDVSGFRRLGDEYKW